jgi:hypothetical protein
MRSPSPDFEGRLTMVVSACLSVFFVLVGVGLSLIPLGTSGDSDCGNLVHSYVGWSRCGTSRSFALGGVVVGGLLALVFAVAAARAGRGSATSA